MRHPKKKGSITHPQGKTGNIINLWEVPGVGLAGKDPKQFL